jgi:hypothetical protein
MKKIYLPIILFCLLSIIFVPVLVKAGIVPCNGPDCTIDKFFEMLGGIYNFIVKDIATPLAVIAVTVGGILMLISAGNPNLMSTGKKVFYSGIIGLVLVFCSYLIIKFILTAIGYTGTI